MIDNITSTGTTQLIKEFELTMGNPEYPVTLHLPIGVPCCDDPAELAHRVIQHHNLPIYMLEELTFELRKFQNAASSSAEKEQALSQLARLHSGKISVDDIAHFWEDMDFQRWPSPAEDAELPHLYHALVHSEEGSALLQLEHQYSREVAVLVRRRDDCVKELSESQAAAMGDAMTRGASDAQVNALTTEQLEAAQVACAEWNSAITALREQQLRTFQAVLRDGSVAGQVQSPVPTISPDPAVPLLEESFTIHLGTQMKQMYNLRLVAADAVVLCDYAQQDGCDLPPQRIQTSLQLYGRSLHGMVMMVDDRVNSYSGIKKEFGAVCGRATELHFPHLDQQLEDIRERVVPAACSWRGRRAGGESGDCTPGRSPATSLLPGDVYITRHSNLSGVHVVFHVVCDDSLRSAAIGSRHAVILGLRNLLKVACLCDLSSLSLPLLLSHTLAEHMTVPWCMRRAELVYKCVKGFMMEMASWGGAHINTLHFVLPKNISEAQFQALSAMLPSIFRVSNPLVVTADPSTHSSL